MGAIVKELKEKIVAAGGDVTGVQTVSEALDKLPTGGGSGQISIIKMNSYRLDATYEEIWNMVANGSLVYAMHIYEEVGDSSIDFSVTLGYVCKLEYLPNVELKNFRVAIRYGPEVEQIYGSNTPDGDLEIINDPPV